MAKSVDKVTLLLDLKGFKAVKGLGQDFAKFKSTVKLSAKEVDKAVKGLTKYHGNTKLSTNSLRGQISALTRLKDNVGINTKAYKRLSTALEVAKNKMNQLTNAQQKQGKFSGLRAGAGAALLGATGQFLPQGAQIGGIAGFAKGGLKGGIQGAGIGLAVDAVAGGVQFARQSAIQASQVQKLRIALKGVTKDQATYKKALDIIANTSKKLNVPIAASTKQFTTLSASVLGAGGSIEDAEDVFTGVSNAIKATGGDAEDVQSAIRAMSQIFGKGKVSAEELQGQLGERLAGAVVKFAEANGSSLQKLQKDLRDGTVGLDQVITFAKKLNIDFAKTAEQVANSSADAGQRLQTQIQNISIEIGLKLIPVGAALQQQFSEIADSIANSEGAITALVETLKFFGGFLFSTIELLKLAVRGTIDFINVINHLAVGQIDKASRILNKSVETTLKDVDKNIKILKGMSGSNDGTTSDDSGTTNTNTDGLATLTGDEASKAQSILDKYRESVLAVNEQIANSFVNTFKKLEDSLVEFVQTGAFNFKKLAQSIISDITRIFIRSQIIAPLTGGLSNIFGGSSPTRNLIDAGTTFSSSNPIQGNFNPFDTGDFVKYAKGGVFAKNKIVPYAMGGIIDRPQIFPLANGAALAGESGPESIMPLKRGRDGKLGVIANGGGVGNIVVNVDASGSSVEGDSAQSEQFGRALAAAIQSELIEQQRPGGLLT